MKFLILTLVIFVSGCYNNGSSKTTEWPSVPDGLKDCSFYILERSGAFGVPIIINVVRCPKSTTSTITQEKYPVTTITDDMI